MKIFVTPELAEHFEAACWEQELEFVISNPEEALESVELIGYSFKNRKDGMDAIKIYDKLKKAFVGK